MTLAVKKGPLVLWRDSKRPNQVIISFGRDLQTSVAFSDGGEKALTCPVKVSMNTRKILTPRSWGHLGEVYLPTFPRYVPWCWTGLITKEGLDGPGRCWEHTSHRRG